MTAPRRSRPGRPDGARPACAAGRQGLSAGGLDGAQGFARLRRLGLDDPAAHTGLNGDDADAVRDHVVQLSCDPQPFGGYGLVHLLRTEGHRVLAALAVQQTGHAGGGHRQRGDHCVDGQAVPVREEADHQELHGGGRGHGHDRSPPRAGGDDVAQDEVRRQEGQELALIRGCEAAVMEGVRSAHHHSGGSEECHGQSQLRLPSHHAEEQAHGQQRPDSVDRARSPRRAPHQQTHHEEIERTPAQAAAFVLVMGGVPSREQGLGAQRAQATE